MKVPMNVIVLCRCVQIESRWNRCELSSGSPVATVTRHPNSVENSRPTLFIGPNYYYYYYNCCYYYYYYYSVAHLKLKAEYQSKLFILSIPFCPVPFCLLPFCPNHIYPLTPKIVFCTIREH